MDPLLMLIPILFPFIAGALLPFVTGKKVAVIRLYSLTVSLITSVMIWALILFCDESAANLISFTDKFVLSLRFDGLGRFFAGIVATLWPLTVLYGIEYMKEDQHQHTFFGFFLIAYGVTAGVAMSGNLFTLYCFYEMLTLSTAPLVMHEKTPAAIRATRLYFTLSLGGAAFAFISMVYIVSGATLLNSFLTTEFFYLLGFFGFGVKAAVFPLHRWLPKASVAPTPVTALLHAVAVVKSGVFAIIRLTYYAYGTDLLRGSWAINIALIFVLFTVFFGSTMALKETHWKRRLAYSTVANLSYILFGALLLTKEGLTAALLHMAFHAEIKILCFFAAGAVLHQTKREYIRELDGLGRKMKVTFACFLAGALGLIGIPPFSGFISKWYLVTAGIRQGTPLAYAGAAVILVSALLTAMYCLSVLRRAYFPEKTAAPAALSDVKEANLYMLLPMLLLAAAILLTGIFAGPITEAVSEIAASIMP